MSGHRRTVDLLTYRYHSHTFIPFAYWLTSPLCPKQVTIIEQKLQLGDVPIFIPVSNCFVAVFRLGCMLDLLYNAVVCHSCVTLII